jgi:hypothetical protein
MRSKMLLVVYLLGLLFACDDANLPRGRTVTVKVASIKYSYDGLWRLFDTASSAQALSDNGLVVAEARVTTPAMAGPINSLDVEEIIYREQTREVVAKGSIRFDVYGNVIAYQSTSGMSSPIFNRWPVGGGPSGFGTTAPGYSPGQYWGGSSSGGSFSGS